MLDERDAGRAFDQFDLIAVGSVDKDEPAAGGTSGRTVGDRDAFLLESGDRVVKVVDFKRQMDEIFLNLLPGHSQGSCTTRSILHCSELSKTPDEIPAEKPFAP